MARFQPGQSGNPSGKRKGTRNKATMALEALLDKDAANITRKAAELALAGDLQALRICMDRIFPARKDRPVLIDLPAIQTPADALRVAATVADAVSGGRITPSEGAELMKIVDSYVRAVETHDFAERLTRLERQRNYEGERSTPEQREAAIQAAERADR